MGYDARTIKRWEKGEVTPRAAILSLVKSLIPASMGSPESTFTFIDLFAGIGGMRLGFESVGGRCVLTSEWDKYCQQTYRANFGDENLWGDVRQLSNAPDLVPDHDLLLAGFPCQPFSIAGVSKKNALGRPHGFSCTTQGTLFFDVEQIIRAKRPSAFLLENVKHLQRHDSGRTFSTIMRVLEDDLHYKVYPKIVDAACFVPQHRERIFLVGFREHVPFKWEDVILPDPDSAPRLSSVLHPEDGSEEPDERYTDEKGRVLEKYTLSNDLWKYLREYAAKHQAKGNGFGYGLFGPDDVARTLSARYYKDGSEILIKQKGRNPRRLTPRECARLMGFDQPGRSFRIAVSDTQAYKQFGNSVVVPVVQAIAGAMSQWLSANEKADQLALELSL
jgi:DNA (cytosine-5)-methyltransferase 1